MHQGRIDSSETEFYNKLKEEVEDVDANFNHNLDEVLEWEFEDAQEITVVISKSY